MVATVNPYLGLSYAELCGLRKDYAKAIQGAQAARKHAERHLCLIREAMDNPGAPRSFEASDHAVVRYLERVAGFDVSAVREAIAFNCENGSAAIGDQMRGADGFLYVTNAEGFVTTVLPLDGVMDELREHVEGVRNRRHNRQRRFARRAGKELLAQGMAARSGETGTGSTEGNSPVAESDAP